MQIGEVMSEAGWGESGREASQSSSSGHATAAGTRASAHGRGVGELLGAAVEDFRVILFHSSNEKPCCHP